MICDASPVRIFKYQPQVYLGMPNLVLKAVDSKPVDQDSDVGFPIENSIVFAKIKPGLGSAKPNEPGGKRAKRSAAGAERRSLVRLKTEFGVLQTNPAILPTDDNVRSSGFRFAP